jgi:hypothetical protein
MAGGCHRVEGDLGGGCISWCYCTVMVDFLVSNLVAIKQLLLSCMREEG